MRERDKKTHINKWILTYKPTMTGIEIGKLSLRRTVIVREISKKLG